MSGRRVKQRHGPLNNAARERSRVQSLRTAFLELQRSLPAVPPDTKLSKLDILVLATAYIYHLTRTLNEQADTNDKSNVSRRNVSEPAFAHFKTLKTARWENDDDKFDTSTFHIDSSSRRNDSIFKVQAHHVHINASGTENQNRPTETLLHVKSDPVNNSTDQFLSQFLRARPYHGQSTTAQSLEKTNSEQNDCRPSGSKSHLLTGKRGPVGIMHPVKKWPMRCRLYQQILGCRPPT